MRGRTTIVEDQFPWVLSKALLFKRILLLAKFKVRLSAIRQYTRYRVKRLR